MPPGKKRTLKTSRKLQYSKNNFFAYGSFFLLAFCVSFTLPNLVFSGAFFFTDLHLLKWVVTLTPLALIGVAVGYRLSRYGAEATSFTLDAFGLLWFLLLLYTGAQPLWTEIRSVEAACREWLFFASVWLAYILAFYLNDKRIFRAVLWGSVLNGALSVLFAELQRNGLAADYPFVISTQLYVANAGQLNMLALWLAICGLNGVFLFFSAERRKLLVRGILCIMLGGIVHGLLSTNSRSGVLAFFMGLFILILFFLRYADRKTLIRGGVFFLLLLLLTVVVVNFSPLNSRFSLLRWKISDMTTRMRTISESKPWLMFRERGTVWATTWTMFSEHPYTGVGLGQYKWNYFDAQREAQRRWPHLEWGFTYWAHNEFLQWFAETGLVGGLPMLFLWLWWAGATLRALITKPPLTPAAFWGSSMAMLFLFNAMWTRPFHRIENAVWLALAFAMANRELLRPLFPSLWREKARFFLRPLGALICIASLLGLFYLADGVRGDRTIRLALLTPNPLERSSLLEKARRSPMVRDLAEKQLAQYYITLGELQNDPDLIAQGINRTIEVFEKQPHIDELKVLRKWATRLKHANLDRYVSYFTDIPDDLTEAAGGGR